MIETERKSLRFLYFMICAFSLWGVQIGKVNLTFFLVSLVVFKILIFEKNILNFSKNFIIIVLFETAAVCYMLLSAIINSRMAFFNIEDFLFSFAEMVFIFFTANVLIFKFGKDKLEPSDLSTVSLNIAFYICMLLFVQYVVYHTTRYPLLIGDKEFVVTYGSPRFSGIFTEPAHYAFFQLYLLSIACLTKDIGNRKKCFEKIKKISVILSILLAQSLSGYILLTVFIITIILSRLDLYSKIIVWVLSLLGGILFMIYYIDISKMLIQSNIGTLKRIGTVMIIWDSSDGSAVYRFFNLCERVKMCFVKYNFFGTGLGNDVQWLKTLGFQTKKFIHVDGLYTSEAVSYLFICFGVIGGFLMLAGLGYMLFSSKKRNTNINLLISIYCFSLIFQGYVLFPFNAFILAVVLYFAFIYENETNGQNYRQRCQIKDGRVGKKKNKRNEQLGIAKTD